MTRTELDAMPNALRSLSDQIKSPDDVPAMCLRDAAAMIEDLRDAVADATVSNGHVPPSASWLTILDLFAAGQRKAMMATEPVAGA